MIGLAFAARSKDYVLEANAPICWRSFCFVNVSATERGVSQQHGVKHFDSLLAIEGEDARQT
jgi:hypothetical protein